MTAVIERECSEHIHWHPYVTVEKYSVDQTSYAEHKLEELRSWRRLPLIRNFFPAPRLHGDWLRELFPQGPEDGYAYDDGNLLVNAGLQQIIAILNGQAQSNSIRNLSNGQTVVGVGNSSTAATTADTALGADNTANAFYQSSDATFPSTTNPATINNQSTFASGNANFAWNEWCWATGVGTITAGNHLSAVFATALAGMINHKVPASSLGTKASGASWVFSTTIVFS